MKSTNTKKKNHSKVRLNSTFFEMKKLISEGNGHMRSGIIDEALLLYNKALELSPKDKKALIARSKCHLRLGDAHKALQDAESALEVNLKDIDKSRAIFCKAEALFHLGDFEMSLVYYHRGMRIRPEFDHFRQGVQKAKEAIQNILEKQVIAIVPEHPEQPQTKTNPVASVRPTTPSRITLSDLSSTTFSETSTVTGLFGNENKKQTANNMLIASTKLGGGKKASNIPILSFAKDGKKGLSEANLLGRLNVDKKYLQNLLKRPDIKVPYQNSARHITIHAQEGIHFLQSRQEFWRQQRANIDQ